AVAVLGSNIGHVYPAEHKTLARQIAQSGAVITEFSSRCPTVPGNFPRRNRVIAGCSRGVLVVQAGEKSGSIHTADWALELGIDVWAIPGEISDPLREGTHRLIKQGAHLVS
ncbi:MAG TPA: DNA-protecting protein DprA, partial [Firmicutes bacterium]|nr:DNA-protecting protein DprA [Bacillota bacterium]